MAIAYALLAVVAVVAVVAGAMLPAQAAVNARLGRSVGSPVWAAAISGVVLTAALALVATAVTRAGPRTAGLGSLPWWAWIGGLCGAVDAVRPKCSRRMRARRRAKSFLTRPRSNPAMQAGCLCNGGKGDLA